MYKEKTGAGIITCNRNDFLIQCIKSLPKNIDYLVVVNDGKESVRDIVKDLRKCELIEHTTNQGVTVSKNDAFKSLLKKTKRGIAPKFLYGGSVNGKNAIDYVQLKEIDGALVGGASLKADEFKKIINAVKK